MVKHEYVDGQVYAGAGESDRHNRISGNIYARLVGHLDGNECEPFMSDMKLFVSPHAFYPEVMVACEQPINDSYFRTQPVLIVEVLSPSTERVDRKEKLAAYRGIPTLREYAIVVQDLIEVELRRRVDDKWRTEIYRDLTDAITFESIDFTLTVADIYRNVRFGFEA